MFNHRPEGYTDPFELVVGGVENEKVYTKQDDIVYRDDVVTAFISSHWWPRNPGNVIIVPNESYENMYDLPDEVGSRIFSLARKIGIALKETYRCDGTSIRQHNEPAGGQDVWHYHLHVFPRWENDTLYQSHDEKRLTTPEERKPYAEKLKAYFAEHV